jgi:Fis family transcriptional regulator
VPQETDRCTDISLTCQCAAIPDVPSDVHSRMNPPKPSAAPKRRKKNRSGPQPLRDSASEAIGHFLQTLDGEPCSELYEMVLHQVEEPLFKAVLDYTQHNQSHAAAMLGLNRGTLRKKLRQHGLLAESEPPKPKRSTSGGKAPANSKTTSKGKR